MIGFEERSKLYPLAASCMFCVQRFKVVLRRVFRVDGIPARVPDAETVEMRSSAQSLSR